MNDMLVIPFGFSLPIHYFIALVFIPKLLFHYKLIPKNTKGLVVPLYIEFFYLVLLAFIFGYIEPWVSRFDYQRSWGQLAEGRAVIQVFRLISEFSLILIIVLWLKMKKVTMDFIVKAIAIIISCVVVFTLIDFSLGGLLKEFLFPDGRLLNDRFTGLNGEPRALGRICSFVLLILLACSDKKSNSTIKIGIVFSILGLVISLSASAYLMTLVWLVLFILVTRRFNYLFFGVPLLFIFFFILSQNEMFRESTLKKIENTVSEGDQYNQREKVNFQEPEIFANFEIFDRAALNFLYSEPIYFMTGTGPNMISIPSSPYLTASHAAIFEDRIDSVPHSFIINLIARSGIIGVSLWFLFFFRFKYALRNSEKKIKALFFCATFSFFMVSTAIYFLIIAILLYSIQTIDNPTLKIHK